MLKIEICNLTFAVLIKIWYNKLQKKEVLYEYTSSRTSIRYKI